MVIRHIMYWYCDTFVVCYCRNGENSSPKETKDMWKDDEVAFKKKLK